MAKLTRTQKYAGLRDELANDKETATTSSDLSSYADRFNNIQSNLAPETVVKPVVEENPEYIWEPFENKQEPVNTSWESFMQEEPKVEEKKVEPKVEEKVFEASGSSYFDSFMSAPVEEPTKKTDFNAFFEEEEKPEVIEEPVEVEPVYQEVFDDVNDTTDDTISKKERDTYLNQTISDVNVHNIINGEKSLNQIIDNAVNEVRHAEPEAKPVEIVEEEVEDNTYAWDPFTEEKKELDADEVVAQPVVNPEEEKLNNTITQEISKIMDDVANAPVADAKEEIATEIKAEEPEVVQPVVEEKQEDIIEIKNINELKDEPIRNTVSGTIPFVVSTNEDEDIEEDEEDEEGSNTVLNVILIVLIIVLVAVLGLIIFYILKTKGIF